MFSFSFLEKKLNNKMLVEIDYINSGKTKWNKFTIDFLFFSIKTFEINTIFKLLTDNNKIFKTVIYKID
jgi:hypothetical protein